MFHVTYEKIDHEGACSPTLSDQIFIRLISYFENMLLYNISRRGPKIGLIHKDYVSQNLYQSAELNCLPAKEGGRQNQVLRRVLRTMLDRF